MVRSRLRLVTVLQPSLSRCEVWEVSRTSLVALSSSPLPFVVSKRPRPPAPPAEKTTEHEEEGVAEQFTEQIFGPSRCDRLPPTPIEEGEAAARPTGRQRSVSAIDAEKLAPSSWKVAHALRLFSKERVHLSMEASHWVRSASIFAFSSPPPGGGCEPASCAGSVPSGRLRRRRRGRRSGCSP